jgi:hypothetical protein
VIAIVAGSRHRALAIASRLGLALGVDAVYVPAFDPSTVRARIVSGVIVDAPAVRYGDFAKVWPDLLPAMLTSDGIR